MGTALRVTGAPGVGKPPLVCAVAACGRKAGGFVTEGPREGALLARLATGVPE